MVYWRELPAEDSAAAGHSYGPVTVTREAACTADGAQTSTCSRCGSVQNEIIRALGHSFIRNADGDYVCVNEQNAGGEPATVVSAEARRLRGSPYRRVLSLATLPRPVRPAGA